MESQIFELKLCIVVLGVTGLIAFWLIVSDLRKTSDRVKALEEKPTQTTTE